MKEKYTSIIDNQTIKTTCKDCNKVIVVTHPIYNDHLGEVLKHEVECELEVRKESK